MTKREHERLAALEARFDTEIGTLKDDVTEIKGDVKELLAVHYQQKGMARLGALVWTFVGGLVATAVAWFK